MSQHPGLQFLFLSLALLAAFLFLAGAATAEDGKVSVTLSPGPYEIQTTPQGHEVSIEDFGRLLVPGKPNLPARIFAVAVPPGAEVTGVTFEKGQAVVLPGAYRITPCPQPRVPGGEDPLLYERDKKIYEANHQSVYGNDAPYPACVGEFVRRAGYRKYNLADVRITPFIIHPQSGRLLYYPNVTVNVHYTLPEPLPAGTVLCDSLARTEKIARNIVLNYDQAQAWYPGGRSSGGRGLHDFVIVTLSSLVSTVQPLVDWETTKGRSVKVVTTSWISYNCTGYDLAEKTRNFLMAKYPSGEWGIEDVLLVGHRDDVPMRQCWQDLGYGMPETDFYYSELSLPDSLSWDIDEDRKWGEDTDPNDFYGEVNVGRIPWSDAETVRSICDKSAAYENNNDPSFKKNILLLGGFFWSDTDNAVLMEYKTDPAIHPWMSDWTATRLYEQNSDYYSSYPCDQELLNCNAVIAWSSGKYAFVNWGGHGSPTSCHILGRGTPQFISTADSQCLDDHYPSIVFANACSNSDTDYTNIGQTMLQQGAVGFLGATKVALGVHGWDDPYDGCCSSMDYFFTTCVTSGDYTQGEALKWTLDKMYTFGLFYYVKYEMFEWSSLWGNPDLGVGMWAPLAVYSQDEMPEGMYPPGPETRMTIVIEAARENYVPGSGLLHYRFDPGCAYGTAPLTHLGGDLYEAVLPNTRPGDRPEFYFSAQGDGGSTISLPFGAPADVYSFDVGFVDVVSVDDFESNLGWTFENHNIQNGEWEHADPDGTSAQPEDDHSEAGVNCFVTGKDGVSIGYDDLDGGPTYLISPDYDFSVEGTDFAFYVWFFHSAYGIQLPFEVHVSNDGGSSWVKVMEVTHRPGWNYKSFTLSDYVTPTSTVKVRFTADDEPNDDVVEAAVDDFMVLQVDSTPSLWAESYSMSAAAGAEVDFCLDAESVNGNRTYMLLGSMSGTSPGTPLPGGGTMPLNKDAFTNMLLWNPGSPHFVNFRGSLSAWGTATATFDTLGPVNPGLVGTEFSFAYLLLPQPCFTSNPVTLTLDP